MLSLALLSYASKCDGATAYSGRESVTLAIRPRELEFQQKCVLVVLRRKILQNAPLAGLDLWQLRGLIGGEGARRLLLCSGEDIWLLMFGNDRVSEDAVHVHLLSCLELALCLNLSPDTRRLVEHCLCNAAVRLCYGLQLACLRLFTPAPPAGRRLEFVTAFISTPSFTQSLNA